MSKKSSTGISLGDIAKAAGLSKTAVCYALRNYPSVSQTTRERVQQIAKSLGYAPDAMMASWMTRLYKSKSKELLPIAWLNTHSLPGQEDVWRREKFLLPYLEGARERCQMLGYRLEEFWTRQPDMTMRRLSQILYQRGIAGVIITYPAKHVNLKWSHLASVAIGGSLLAPRLHRVNADMNYNLTLALKLLRRRGYRRIGICFSDQVDRFSHRMLHTIADQFVATASLADRVPPMFYRRSKLKDEISPFPPKELLTWLRDYRPEVLVGADGDLTSWVQEFGLRVPQDIGVVHISLDDDVLDWAGIHSNKKEIGGTAAEWVISMVQNHRFGVPRVPLTTLVRGSWQYGNTLQISKIVPTGKASA